MTCVFAYEKLIYHIDIMQSGAIASLLSIAASAMMTTMSHPHLAVTILKLLSSDDTDRGCNRRQKLCHAGATAALSSVLATVLQTMEQQHDPQAVSSLPVPTESQLLLCNALCALVNIFDFVQQESQKCNTNNSASELNPMLVAGWWDIDDKHLTGILCIVRILLSPYLNGRITLQSGTRSVMSITKKGLSKNSIF